MSNHFIIKLHLTNYLSIIHTLYAIVFFLVTLFIDQSVVPVSNVSVMIIAIVVASVLNM